MPNIDMHRASELLASDHDASATRSEAARLAELIDQIEAALARGVRRVEVLARLHQSGFTMSLRTFDKALYRIRKRQGRSRARATTPTPAPRNLPDPTSKALVPGGPPLPVETQTLSDGRVIKTAEQLKRENPTMPSMQISKLYAQQYAGPALSAEVLEEMKRKYNPPQIKR